ncbi:helix-turn-helix domain-containing protein [Mycolicibacterium sp.]|uniref:helix-turn-helix domain-containing protein n=1 Tax=Mycolicibacterium sp. TaxID=2320850 RepID=UPI0034430272
MSASGLPLSHNTVENWDVRIGRYLTSQGEALVSPRIAAWLEETAGLTSDRRILLRGTDPEAYAVLAALHLAALHHRSGVGTKSATGTGNSRELGTWLTTAEAAKELSVTDRAVRKRIAAGRLPATKHGSRWLLNRDHVQIAQALA